MITNYLRKKHFFLLLFLLLGSFMSTKAATVYFNTVWPTVGSYDTESSSIKLGAAKLSGTNFSFSDGLADKLFPSGGNNISGTLRYYDASGALVSIPGIISRQDKSGNTTLSAYFISGTTAYILVIPSKESNYTANGTVTTSSDPIVSAMNDVINNTPTLVVSNYDLPNLSTCFGTASTHQSFTLSGANLSSAITIKPPASGAFEISITNATSDYTTSNIVINKNASNAVPTTTVYVRLIASAPAGTYDANVIVSSSTNSNDQTTTISGSVTATTTTSNAGSNQTICNNSSATLNGNSPTNGVGAWSVVSGPSTLSAQFSSTSLRTATFTPAGGAGTYILRWTITNSPCPESTSDVTITVNATPNAPTAGNGSRFASGTVSLSASVGDGQTVDWYANSSGGTALSIGSTTFTTPSISATTKYYAQARNSTTNCISASRTEVTATINPADITLAIANPSAVTESADKTYLTFEAKFSKDRSASGRNIVFTPTLSNGSATSGDDIVSLIEYSFTGNSSWNNANAGITVNYNQGTVYLRVEVKDDTRPEHDETFTINTGTLSGDGSEEMASTNSTSGTGTIADNNDPLVWNGDEDDSWINSKNWTPNDLVPHPNFYIEVPGGRSRYPILTDNSNIKNLKVFNGGKITINSPRELSVKLDVNNDGEIIGDGQLVVNGTTKQNLSGNGTYRKLKIDNTAGVDIASGPSNMVNITGVLTPNNGVLTTNNNLTFKSNSKVNGIIGTVNCGNASINGNVTTERSIPGNQRAFRFLTPGVTSTSSINANWQEGQNNTALGLINNKNAIPKFGTHITGSTNGQNGFDATLTGNPSLFTYNIANQSWVTAANTNATTLEIGKGYRVLVRGSRATDMSTNTPIPDSTTIRSTGIPCLCTTTFNTTGSGTNVNTQVILDATPNDYTLIGNPYWAYVNWHTVNKTGIANFYYVWDPTIEGTNKRGGFVTWTKNDNEDTGYSSIPSVSDVGKYIQPGQAFFVKTTNANASITFNEADKYNSELGRKKVFSTEPPSASALIEDIPAAGPIPTPTNDHKISVMLYLSENIQNKPADGTTLLYGKNWSDALGYDDADKLSNLDENIALVRESKLYAFEGRNRLSVIDNDSVNLRLWNLNSRKYTIRVDATNFSGPHQLFLVNRVDGKKILVPQNSVFDYTITPTAGQKVINDFYLSISMPVNDDLVLINVDKGLMVYPNPVTDYLTIKWDATIQTNKNASLSITDLNGNRLLSQQIEMSNYNRSLSIDMSKLTRGTYILEFTSDKKTIRKKIIKK